MAQSPPLARKRPREDHVFKSSEWNKFHVKAVGKHIQTWINGQKVSDFMDEKSGMASGFIGLQVHAIPAGTGPYEVRWKDLVIKDLSKKKQLMLCYSLMVG